MNLYLQFPYPLLSLPLGKKRVIMLANLENRSGKTDFVWLVPLGINKTQSIPDVGCTICKLLTPLRECICLPASCSGHCVVLFCTGSSTLILLPQNEVCPTYIFLVANVDTVSTVLLPYIAYCDSVLTDAIGSCYPIFCFFLILYHDI